MKKTVFIALAIAMLVPLVGSAYNFEEAAVSNGYTITSTNLSLSSQGINSLAGATNYTAAIHIDLSQNILADLVANPFVGLTSLKDLNLSGNAITSIVYNTFSGLSALETLRLSGTELQYIPDNHFEDLANLKELDLASNQLGALGTNMFFGLGSLESLDLAGNNLTSVFPGSFQMQANLVNLDLSANDLGTLDYLFFLLPTLEHVDLSGNQIAGIDANSFIGAEALKTLDLSNSQVQTITWDAFNNLTNLVTLSLDGNDIATLKTGTFSGMSKLNSLGLQSSQIISIEGNAFNGLTSISNLNLSHNQIGSSLTNAFAGMPAMTHLNLTDNQLAWISNLMFSGASQLESIDMTSNTIASISSGTFDGFTNLTSLILRNNQLTTVSTNQVSDLPDLQTLDLASNNIYSFGDGAFAGLGSLVYLDLSTNALASVNLNYADLDMLSTLLMDGNIITNLSMEYATVSQSAFDAVMGAFDPGAAPAALAFSQGDELIMEAASPPGLESVSLVGTDLSGIDLGAFNELDTVTSLNLDGTSLDAAEIFTLITELDAMQGSGAVLVVDEVVKADVFSELADAGYSTTNGNVSAGDLDSDGLPDGWEAGYFGSINDPDAGRFDDGDNDDCMNYEEQIAGTDPTNGNSRFEVSSFLNLPSGKTLNWEPVTGRVYSVLWTDTLTNSFSVLTNGIIHPQNSYTDTVHSADGEGFYSIDVKLEN